MPLGRWAMGSRICGGRGGRAGQGAAAAGEVAGEAGAPTDPLRHRHRATAPGGPGKHAAVARGAASLPGQPAPAACPPCPHLHVLRAARQVQLVRGALQRLRRAVAPRPELLPRSRRSVRRLRPRPELGAEQREERVPPLGREGLAVAAHQQVRHLIRRHAAGAPARVHLQHLLQQQGHLPRVRQGRGGGASVSKQARPVRQRAAAAVAVARDQPAMLHRGMASQLLEAAQQRARAQHRSSGARRRGDRGARGATGSFAATAARSGAARSPPIDPSAGPTRDANGFEEQRQQQLVGGGEPAASQI
jgi:hypothetical protein